MQECSNPLCKILFVPGPGSTGKYCSLSCGTRHRNQLVREKKNTEYLQNPKICKSCSLVLSYKSRKYNFCSRSCSASFNNTEKPKRKKKPILPRQSREELFEQGLLKGRPSLRNWLTKINGYRCSVCGISDWNGKSLVLVVDHIDGNASNNLPSNLRLLCPNCNSQTPTFSGRNKGKGRKSLGLPLW